MKIATIVGARPQFIKAAAVSRPLRAHPDIVEILIHTGQHYDVNMSDVFFRELDIPKPDIHLEIGSGKHGQQTGRMLEVLEKTLLEEKPDLVLVYGDTNSTLAGALAAAKLNIPVAHVEAGLRSFNRQMPEEINRILTDHIADLLFVPTEVAEQNLRNEGIDESKIFFTGDVMYDATLHFRPIAEATSQILEKLSRASSSYALATIHRAENTDDISKLSVIFEALIQSSLEIPIVMPLHPRTRLALTEANLLQKVSKAIQIIDPVGYLDMIMLEKHAQVIITDSGGVQKEAFFHETPCITLRDQTEWLELVDAKWNTLCPPINIVQIVDTINTVLDLPLPRHISLYGNGKATQLIIESIRNFI